MVNKINPNDYDHIIIYFSGGKDSLACLLHLIEIGTDMSKVELWHHEIDGREGGNLNMDWPITPDYCRSVAKAFDLAIYFSWKVGGFEREMLRNNSLTSPTRFELPSGEIRQIGGKRGKPNTRLKFPQVSANLSVRWCSAYLKIDVGSAAIRNQARFNGKRVLTISGERAEESASRANYKSFEPDRSDNRNGRSKRHIDRWRPVHGWKEKEIWEVIKRHNVNPHPAYHLGWGRVSCMTCIFGSDNQWASVNKIAPEAIERISSLENEFGHTIHRTLSVVDRIKKGNPYQMDKAIPQALADKYTEPIIVNEWKLPAGAFGESCGPT